MAKKTEACGRCSMTVVVDAIGDEEGEESDDSRNPFSGARIEVDNDELDRISPGAWTSRISSRIDAAIDRHVWGR